MCLIYYGYKYLLEIKWGNLYLLLKIKIYYTLTFSMHVCVLSFSSHVQLFVTPRTVACEAPLSIGFSRQEYRSGLPCPPPEDPSDPRVKLASLWHVLHRRWILYL